MKVVRLSALSTGRLYPPGNIPGTHFYQRLSRPQGHSVAGRIMSMKKSNNSGDRNRDLPACSAVQDINTSIRFIFPLVPQSYLGKLRPLNNTLIPNLQGPRLPRENNPIILSEFSQTHISEVLHKNSGYVTTHRNTTINLMFNTNIFIYLQQLEDSVQYQSTVDSPVSPCE